jgi:hypothetical protein
MKIADYLNSVNEGVSNQDRDKFIGIISSNKDVRTNKTNWGDYFTYKGKEYGPYKTNDELIKAVLKIVK